MITLYYEVAKLVNRVNTNALLIGRNIKQDRSNDFFHLGVQDAEDFIKDKIRSIANRIFADCFIQYSRDMVYPNGNPVTPFSCEADADEIEYNFNLPEGADPNVGVPLLQAVEDAIIEYVTYEWLYHTNYDYRKAEQIYKEHLDRITGMMSKRHGVILRNYKYY